jgi:uncharacterized protein YeaO (DUF488 family)
MSLEKRKGMVKIKRAYEPAARSDGYRILVDRLWPRGIKKAELALNEWAKELAPSNELRKQFGHDPEHWRDFVKCYRAELKEKVLRDKILELSTKAQRGTVTLVYSARDEEHNNARVLKDLLVRSSKGAKERSKPQSRKAA